MRKARGDFFLESLHSLHLHDKISLTGARVSLSPMEDIQTDLVFILDLSGCLPFSSEFFVLELDTIPDI